MPFLALAFVLLGGCDAASDGTGSGDQVDTRATAWHQAQLEADGRTVVVTALVGGDECNDLREPAVVETDDEVKVSLSVALQPEAEFCAAIGQSVRVPVRLQEPLGSRRLVDGVTGKVHEPKP